MATKGMANEEIPISFHNPIFGLFRSLLRDLGGVYRPERHYMRGPGPKWREKHAPPLSQPEMRSLHATKLAG